MLEHVYISVCKTSPHTQTHDLFCKTQVGALCTLPLFMPSTQGCSSGHEKYMTRELGLNWETSLN